MSKEIESFAHSANCAGRCEPLREHLVAVAERASRYAAIFGASDEARFAGALHDLGKYGDLFQRRLRGEVGGIDHWTPGAVAALHAGRAEGVPSAVAIQGHHLGLQKADASTLRNRMRHYTGGGCRIRSLRRLLCHRFANLLSQLPDSLTSPSDLRLYGIVRPKAYWWRIVAAFSLSRKTVFVSNYPCITRLILNNTSPRRRCGNSLASRRIPFRDDNDSPSARVCNRPRKERRNMPGTDGTSS